MELIGLLITVTVVVIIWREQKAAALRRSAEAAVLECTEEIQRLRGAIMAGAGRDIWERPNWEGRRQRVLMALDQFHTARLGDKYDRDLARRALPSFQNEQEWEKWRILARGPYPSAGGADETSR